MPKRKLTPPTTKPGFVVMEVVDAADGGYCLVANNTRIAGCEPALHENNVYFRWNVREEYLQEVLKSTEMCRECGHKGHFGKRCLALVPDDNNPFAERGVSCGCSLEGASTG